MIAAILVGGSGRRFGSDKLFYKIGERSVIEETLARIALAKRIDEIYLVSSKGKGSRFEELGFPVIEDPYSIGPIGGLLYSLESLGSCFVAAGDMPLISPSFVDLIVEEFESGEFEACVPCWESGYLEPLHAAYSVSFKEKLRREIERGERSIVKVLSKAKVKKIPLWGLPQEYRISLFNLNEKKDLEELLRKRNNR